MIDPTLPRFGTDLDMVMAFCNRQLAIGNNKDCGSPHLTAPYETDPHAGLT